MAIRGIVEQEPVREFAGDPRHLAFSVLRELQTERQRLINELGTLYLKTMEEYRERRGKIDGIDIAISICQKVQGKLEA